MSMLLPWFIYDTGSMWGSHAWKPITHWVSAVRPKEKAHRLYFLCLYSHGNRKWIWGETSGLFWVNVIYLFFPLGFLMFYSFFLNFFPFLEQGPYLKLIGFFHRLQQDLGSGPRYRYGFLSTLLCIRPLVIPSGNALCICWSVCCIPAYRIWRCLFSFILNMFHWCQQHLRYYTNSLGSREGRQSLFLSWQRSWWTEGKGLWHWFECISTMPGKCQLHAEIQMSLHFIKISTRPLRAQSMWEILFSKPACDLPLEQVPKGCAHGPSDQDTNVTDWTSSFLNSGLWTEVLGFNTNTTGWQSLAYNVPSDLGLKKFFFCCKQWHPLCISKNKSCMSGIQKVFLHPLFLLEDTDSTQTLASSQIWLKLALAFSR